MSVLDEEQYVAGSVIVNGSLMAATPATMRAVQPAGMLTYTFGAPFLAVWRGQHVSYRKGQTVHLDNATKTAWLALGASLTLVA